MRRSSHVKPTVGLRNNEWRIPSENIADVACLEKSFRLVKEDPPELSLDCFVSEEHYVRAATAFLRK